MCVGSRCWERKLKVPALFKTWEVWSQTAGECSLLPQKERSETWNVFVDTANMLAFLGLHLHDVLVKRETVNESVFAVSQLLILYKTCGLNVPRSILLSF